MMKASHEHAKAVHAKTRKAMNDIHKAALDAEAKAANDQVDAINAAGKI